MLSLNLAAGFDLPQSQYHQTHKFVSAVEIGYN